MRKVVIIILAVVVALSALPITFACYNGGWGHHWGWGNWGRFWSPHKIVCYCTDDCKLTFDYGSLDYYDNEGDFYPVKEVAQTYAEITECGKNLSVTVNNAYPGYVGTVDFCIRNDGFYPATVNGLEIVPDIPFYAQLDFTGITMGTVIPAGDMQCGQLVIHSVPQSEEAQGKTFTFDITIDFVCYPIKCETAYAYNEDYSQCFIDLGYNSWGWTNGPLAPGTYEFDIYAGAAKCDLSKGELIGTLNVIYDGSTVSVFYDITGSDYAMTGTHVYVGTAQIPPNDKPGAPGLYPYQHDLNYVTTDSYPPPLINGFSGEDIYIIAHAVACPQ
jgi:hypothetical protein